MCVAYCYDTCNYNAMQGEWVSFGCCFAAVSVRKVDRCRLTAVGVMCAVLCWACNYYVELRHSVLGDQWASLQLPLWSLQHHMN